MISILGLPKQCLVAYWIRVSEVYDSIEEWSIRAMPDREIVGRAPGGDR
jgi:hypothetical protein